MPPTSRVSLPIAISRRLTSRRLQATCKESRKPEKNALARALSGRSLSWRRSTGRGGGVEGVATVMLLLYGKSRASTPPVLPPSSPWEQSLRSCVFSSKHLKPPPPPALLLVAPSQQSFSMTLLAGAPVVAAERPGGGAHASPPADDDDNDDGAPPWGSVSVE